MGFNAPSTHDLSRKETDRAWRQLEQLALKLMVSDPNITKAEAIKKVRQSVA